MIVGEPTDFQTKPVVARVEPGSAADVAGLEVDDEIVEIDGEPVRGDWDRAVEAIKDRPGQSVTITVLRDGERLELGPATLATSHPAEPGVRSGYLGVGPLAIAQGTKHYGPIEAVTTGGRRVGNLMWQSLLGLKTIVEPSTLGRLFEVAAGRTERTFNDPASLYGVGQIAGQLGSEGNFAALFELIVVFNVFIGVANLLPLPPLDGGHLAVLGYEKLARRDVDMRKLIPITTAVILFFGSLFVLLLYLDIARPLPALPG
jgi:RIP metalloprotease RseP